MPVPEQPDEIARAHTLTANAPAEGPPTFLAGELVGERYRIVRLLGAGGMGEVYEAFDETLDKPIALKTLRPAFAAERRSQERFKREILLAHKVTHPNVCRTFDVGFVDGVPFLTMELHAGETLAQRLARAGPLPWAEAAPIVDQLVAGLSAAHEAGVVHLDFKSANVLLVAGERGRAVISDFGIARDEDAPIDSTGALAGSPAYMAPEQVEGKPVGVATDIYALGVVMYEMVTGRLPFQGPTARATAMLRLSSSPRPPRELAPGLAPACEEVILRCLERDPARRFRAVREIPLALARPPRRSRRLGLALGAAVAAAFVVIARPPDAAVPADARTAFQEGRERLAHLDCLAARDLLREATSLAPRFAPAYSDLAEAYSCAGQNAEAIRAATQGLDLAEGLPPDERQLLEARFWRASSRHDRALPIYAALHAAHPERVDLTADLLREQLWTGKHEEARRTLAALREAGVDDERTTMYGLHLLVATQADPNELLLETGRAAARFAQRGQPLLAANARMLRVLALDWLGKLEQSLDEATAARAALDRLGDQDAVGYLLQRESVLLRRLGRIDEAERRAEAIERVARALGSDAMMRNARLSLTQAAWARGELERARALLLLIARDDQLAQQLVAKAQALCLLARVRLSQGFADEARRLRDEAAGTAGVSFFRDDRLGIELEGALAFVGDDTAAARTRYEAALAYDERSGNHSAAGEARLDLARICFAQGDLPAAMAHALVALEFFDRAGQVDQAALTRVVIALAALGEGRLDDAETMIAGARARGQESERPRVRATVALADARIAAARGDLPRARVSAEAVHAETTKLGMAEVMDAELLLGELDLKVGSRQRLEALVAAASTRGMTRMAHDAQRALEGHALGPAPQRD